MIDPIVKKHGSLRTPSGAKAPPDSRTLGDSPGWNDADSEILHEGKDALKPVPFLQAMALWKLEGPSKVNARPRPSRDEDPSSLDRLGP